MKAAVWNANGSLDVTERPAPEPGTGMARIRVESVGICGTDLHFYRGEFPSPAGLLPGHEVSGVVDAVAEGGAIATGTRVAVEPLRSCGVCPQCRTGQYNRCPARQLFGVSGRGGMADYMTAPEKLLYPLGDDVPPGMGALAEPVAVCVRGLRLGGVTLGDCVVVIGGGTIGLISAWLARVFGAGDVVVTARHPHQRAAAERLGARVANDRGEAQGLISGGADRVIETVGGTATTLADATSLARPGGTIAMLGVFTGQTPLPGLEFSTKELTLVGSNCYGMGPVRSDFAEAVDLLGRHWAELEPLVTHTFSLDEVNAAFDAAADKSSGSLKVHIRM
jgi:threonine dehydrogenase-like Zn-dependent dehydrogenase